MKKKLVSKNNFKKILAQYLHKTASGVFKSKLESSEIQAAEDVHEAQGIEYHSVSTEMTVCCNRYRGRTSD